MSKNNTTIQYYYWLNPATLKDKVYRVHLNHTESNNPRWAYGTIPPEAYPLSWRFVFSPHLLSAEESAEIEKAKTAKEKTEEQADLINEINRNKKHRRRDQYIGDSEPIAQGITAFFIKRTPGKEDDYWSVLNSLKRDTRFDIYDWYKAYWEEQKSFAELSNKKKARSQGRLTDVEFLEKFIKDHLTKEQDLLRRSERFFSDDSTPENDDVKSQIRAYVEDYREWVAEKSKDIIQGYDTSYTPEQIKKTYDCYIQKGLLKPTDVDKQEFIQAFTGQILRAPVLWRGPWSELSKIIWVLTKEKPKPQKVNNIFIFPDNKRYDSKNTVPKKRFNEKDYLAVE